MVHEIQLLNLGLMFFTVIKTIISVSKFAFLPVDKL